MENMREEEEPNSEVAFYYPKSILKMTPSSSFKLKSRRHARSISFPSRPQPVFHHLEEQLNRLSDSETYSTSLSFLGDRLSFLQDLYVSVDDLIQMPHIQQSLTSVQASKGTLTDDSYIKILDACTVTKDIFSQAKHDVQELLSSLRRKKDATDASGTFLASRKKAKKTIQKALKDIKNIKISERADQLEAICLLNNVQSVTVCVLESSLSYVMGTKAHSSFVSKLIHNKCKEASQNEFDQMNEALIVPDIEIIQRQLEKMQLKIQDIEEGLNCLFKHLIKTRVSLLNMLSY
ncbi:uncharacterized protein LOC124924794 [Impatiens glandulifera]|uniref:uncharacterized protein LOC124924794 n=1 Tax=Impatiens glandulifera TaxID=253017 RepID=UPI001FB117CD|nr:uncharacterized protein LOC124924794 [Impatiens glandulifera]